MEQNFWTLVLLLGLMKTRPDFFYSEMDRNEPSRTCGQSFISIPMSLTTTSHLLLGSWMLFLWLCERTPFQPDLKNCPQIWCVWQIKRRCQRITEDGTLVCLLRVCRITVNFSLVYSPLIYMKGEAVSPTLTPNFLLWRQLPYLPFRELKVKIASLSGIAATVKGLVKDLQLLL